MTLPNHGTRNTINTEPKGSPLSAEYGNGDPPSALTLQMKHESGGNHPAIPPPSTVTVTYVHKRVTFAWP